MLFRFWVFPDCTFLDISKRQLNIIHYMKPKIYELEVGYTDGFFYQTVHKEA